MFRKPLEKNKGLLFVEKKCGRLNLAIHSFFVFFPFWAVWIDKNSIIVDIQYVKPWQPVIMPKEKACYLAELMDKGNLKVGQKIKLNMFL